MSPCRLPSEFLLSLIFPICTSLDNSPKKFDRSDFDPSLEATLAQSRLKEMNFLCCLLLLGALQTSAQKSPPLAPIRAELWGRTVLNIWENGRSRKEGDDCNVETELTHAYFLLADLIHTHPNSVLEWAWPRYEFYTNASDKVEFMLLQDHDREITHPDVAFCPYRSPNDKLVCDNKKCVNCAHLPSGAENVLKSACALNGNGGADVVTKPKEESSEISVPEVKHFTKTECNPGWLTDEEAGRFYMDWKDGVLRTEHQLCGYFPKVEIAFAYADKLFFSYDNIAKEKQIEEFREFWEDKLRVLKGDNRTPGRLCHPGAGMKGRGPLVCGKDALCIFCSNVTKEMTEIYEACNPQEPTKETQLQKECVGLRDKTITPTSTSTTTDLSSGAALVDGQVALAVTSAAFLLTCYATGLY